MKNFTQFFKTTFILATILLLGEGNVWGDSWSWTGETRSAGQFYFMNKQHSQFMSVNESGAPYLVDLENAFVFTIGASGMTDLAYTVDGTTYYIYQDAGTYGYWVDKQDAPSSGRCTSSFVGMGYGWDLSDWNNGGNHFRFKSNHKYTYSTGWFGSVTNKHESEADRYIYVDSQGKANCTKNRNEFDTDNARWFLISADQKNVYGKRYINFSAIANAIGEGTATASVENKTVELSDYADRNNSHSTKATFTATPNTGKVFVGWSTDAEGSNIISHALVYEPTIYNTWSEGQTSSLTLYAIFGDKFEPSITAEKYDLKVEEQTNLTFTHTENLAGPVIGNPSVISYSDGVVTALAEGTSTLTFTQEETNTIKAKEFVLTFNVSKYANTLAPNQALEFYTTYDNLASLFTTNSDGALTFRLTPDGEEITSITTKNETTFTLYVSQAKTEKVYGVSKREIQFSVHAAAHYAPQILKEVADQVDNIEGNKTYEITWDNSSYDAGTLSFDYKTSGAATRPNPKVYQQVNGNWILIGDKGKTTNWRTVSDENLNSKATGVKFEFSGTGLGSASVKNVVVTRRDYLETDVQSVNDFNTFEIFYGNIHNVQYELTNVSSSNPSAEYEISLSTDEVISNGEGDYGKYVFAIAASTDAPTTITATAHFFTTENMHLYIPVSLTFPVSLSLVAMNNENGTDYYYATFSNADYAVEFGEDVEVYTVSVDGDRMTLYPVSNNQVPANNGVLIKSQSNNILYKYISSASDLSNNMLQPGTGGMTEGDNCRFYRLAYYDYTAKTGLGFYYGSGCEDGGPFKCKAGTAYLAVPRTVAAPARFLLGRQDVSTEIENIIIDNTSTSSSLAEGKKVMMNGVLYIIRDGKTYDSFGRMVK